MKMKYLSDDYYIVMDDSEITTGDIVAEKLLTGKYELFTIHTLNDIDKSTQKKITHSTQPLGFLNEVGLTTANLKPDWTNIEYLPLSEVKELLGEVDEIEKIVNNDNYTQSFKVGFIHGYNQCLEDNKEKKYTEEDMVKAYKMGLMRLSDQRLKDYMLPKTEWEVEFVDGKLKLKL